MNSEPTSELGTPQKVTDAAGFPAMHSPVVARVPVVALVAPVVALVAPVVARVGPIVALVGPIVARVPISIRRATVGDLPFVDGLQKKQSREVGFLQTAALVGKIRLGQILIAEVASGQLLLAGGDGEVVCAQLPAATPPSSLAAGNSQLATPTRVGYLIAADRYFKRDEVGYVTQINVSPEYRRSLVAAELLQYQFDTSAYGCMLYSCWCAQDLKANEFWEAMGFTAIAFRTGSRTKGKNGRPRIHIFWQKRIRANDTTTSWWYPSQTGGGELREDRLLFPIMPGVCWRDVLPVVLPEVSGQLPVGGGQLSVGGEALHEKDVKRETAREKKLRQMTLLPPRPIHRGGLWFAEPVVKEKPVKEKKPKATIGPRLTKMARELRDQWMERSHEIVMLAEAKHDVKRMAATTLRSDALKSIGQGQLWLESSVQPIERAA